MEEWASGMPHSSCPIVRIASPTPSDGQSESQETYTDLDFGSSKPHELRVPNKTLLDLRRTSLHGKPIPIRQCRTDVRYRRLQARIYNFLERPKTWRSMIYHVAVFACVFICLQFSVLSTLKDFEKIAGISLFYLEMFMLFWFFAEYCIRVWSAGCRSRYQTWRGRLRFMHRPFCLVDATVIVASIVVLSMGTDSQRFAASPLRGLRFFQILRMIRMDRRGGSWKLLASVVWAHRQELFTTVYIGFLGLISSSFLVYLLEREVNDKIKSYADALWWGVVTLCTVGYGDTVPKTWMGKMVAACCAVAGISFFALPAGILGSGFALKVQQHQREKHLIRRRVPAATLIQSLWRCYAADVDSTSVATWKIHMTPLKANVSESGEKAPSRLSRFTNVKKKAQYTTSVGSMMSTEILSGPTPTVNRFSTFASIRNALNESMSTDSQPWRSGMRARANREVIPADRCSEDRIDIQLSDTFITHSNKPISTQIGMTDLSACDGFTLSSVDRDLAKANRNNSGLRLKFRTLAHTVRSHMNMASADSPTCLSQNVESPSRGTEEDVEALEPSVRLLTNAEKNAIRSIRKIKFFVARRKFREALRPYDVKDVIEQYSAGHLDMLGRIKLLQSRLDQILGRPGTKDEGSIDPQIPLALRIVKIEQKINGIEAKLNVLIDLHTANQNKQGKVGSYPWTTTTETDHRNDLHPVFDNATEKNWYRRSGRVTYRDQASIRLRHLSLPEEDVDVETIKEEVDLALDTHFSPARNPPEFYALAEKDDDSSDERDLLHPSATELVPLSTAHGPRFTVSSDDLLNISQTEVYPPESEMSSATTDASLSNTARDVAGVPSEVSLGSGPQSKDKTKFET
ncbi:Potassium voltage-gated channel subfamily KQT member 1 [Fasciola hepatica]|uniref:Potassium voltage-gated channel subfamily KQT member 1 n=1 Tax=Fasciola hepatica TaxID=6192 RepID=A0A4E0S341_FASHE|nr:Potassium voltage-gated channel subfamily KQT member 1 [Fasciola hepatica]